MRNISVRVAELLKLPPGAVCVFGLCVGMPLANVTNAVKARLPQSASASQHYDASTGAGDPGKAYDEELAAYSKQHEMAMYTWTERVVSRVQKIKAMSGRHTLKETLGRLGLSVEMSRSTTFDVADALVHDRRLARSCGSFVDVEIDGRDCCRQQAADRGSISWGAFFEAVVAHFAIEGRAANVESFGDFGHVTAIAARAPSGSCRLPWPPVSGSRRLRRRPGIPVSLGAGMRRRQLRSSAELCSRHPAKQDRYSLAAAT